MTDWLERSLKVGGFLSLATACSMVLGWLGMGWWAALPLLSGVLGFCYVFRRSPGAWLCRLATVAASLAQAHALLPDFEAKAKITTQWLEALATFKHSVTFNQLILASLAFAILEIIREAIDRAKQSGSFTTERKAEDPKTINNQHTQEPFSTACFPQGIRPYRSSHHGFYLKLLGGTEENVPESLSFWHERLTDITPHMLLRLGIVWGASGTGKTSFVEAGLVPLVESKFEVRFIRSDMKDLQQALQEVASVKKWSVEEIGDFFNRHRDKPILIIVDQFESWLFQNQNVSRRNPLVRLIQAIDGRYTKILLVVRKEWSESFAHFVNTVGLRTPHYETRVVEQLSIPDAERVLQCLGTAYGRVSANPTPGELTFISSVAGALATKERVQPMLLSIFAYLNKDKAWDGKVTPAYASRIGVEFLERYCGLAAPTPSIAANSDTVASLLWSLLPIDPESSLKDSGKTVTELTRNLKGIGKTKAQPLLNALQELYLIRPVEGEEDRYQLTHDYWISAIHLWFQSKANSDVTIAALVSLRRQRSLWERYKETRYLLSLLDVVDVAVTIRPFMRTSPYYTDYNEFFRHSLRFQALRFFQMAGTLGIIVFSLLILWRNEAYRRAEEWIKHAESVPKQELATFFLASPPDNLVTSIAVRRFNTKSGLDVSLPVQVLASNGSDLARASAFNSLCDRPVENSRLLRLLPAPNSKDDSSKQSHIDSALSVGSDSDRFIRGLANCSRLSQRYQFTHLVARCGMTVEGALSAFKKSQDNDSAFFALLCLHDLISNSKNSKEYMREIEDAIRNCPEQISDPGVVALERLILDDWPDSKSQELAKSLPVAPRTWRLLEVLPSATPVTLGSDLKDPDRAEVSTPEDADWERQHSVIVDYTFALCAYEVTLADYRRFTDEVGMRLVYEKKFAVSDNYPINRVSWHAAAAYCNWLSQKAGLPESELCFEVKWTEAKDGSRTPQASLKEDALSKTGFRLPSSAEWEIAARGGEKCRRFFGDSDELLNGYSVNPFNTNSSGPRAVGALKPNRLGFFDMLGNNLEWTLFPQKAFQPGTHSLSDISWQLSDDRDGLGETRGASFYNFPHDHRSSDRMFYRPDANLANMGFRVAVTVGVLPRKSGK